MRTELVKLWKSIQYTVLVWFLELQNGEWGMRKHSCCPLGPAIWLLTTCSFQLGLESCLELIREEVQLVLNRDTIDIINFITDLIIDPQYNVYWIGPADYQVGRCDSQAVSHLSPQTH